MARVLVVADDLTGANASAAGFARAGMRALTLGRLEHWGTIAEFHARFDAIVVTTDSRHAAQGEVRELVQRAVRAGWPVELLSCRIDTTLRGNVGVATEAMLTEARRLSDDRVVALCLAAHPAAGRVTVGGHQLLHGQRLETTELAQDARSPVTTSEVAAVLRRSTGLQVGHLPLHLVTGPAADLAGAIHDLLTGDVDVIVADSITEDHLARVAAAAVAVAADERVRWVCVDPGPGAVALAAALGISGGAGSGPLLAVSGSATELTRQQLNRLIAERQCRVVRPVLLPDSAVPQVDATVRDVVAAVEQSGPGSVVLLATVLHPSDLRELTQGEREALPAALGKITRRVLQEVNVDGLYTTGGDVTAAVLGELGGQGLAVEGEVVPLAVAGEIVSGPWAGLPMVTKGGLVGTSDTAIACLDQLRRLAHARIRSVRSAASRDPTHL